MHGAHACLVPVNYFVASIFEYLQIHGKTHSSIRAADLRHLLLLLPFVLDNLLKDEVDKYNRDKAQGSDVLVDPSEELVMVANTFVSWYKLFRRTNPPKTADSYNTGRPAFGHVYHCVSIQKQEGAADHGHREGSLPKALWG